MKNEQRNALQNALKEVHDIVHSLYPREADTADPGGQALRNQLLVVDLAMHLADEVAAATMAPDIDEAKVVERTANLLFAIKLLAPEYRLKNAAELLLEDLRPMED